MSNLRLLIDTTNHLEYRLRSMVYENSTPVNPITIPPLPAAPDKLTKPETFEIDSPRFLDALPAFVTALNINLDNIRFVNANKWNMGTIVNQTYQFPRIYSGNPNTLPKPSIDYVNAISNEYKYLENYSYEVNDFFAWVNDLVDVRGTVGLNPVSTNVVHLTNPPTRTQQEVEFNAKSIEFSQSLREHTRSLNQALLHLKENYEGTKRLGRVSERFGEVINCGQIIDPVTTN